MTCTDGHTFRWEYLDGEVCQTCECGAIRTSNEIETMLSADGWYGEKAEALERYGNAKPPQTQALMAVVTELMLDAGRKARGEG